ncbi:hypothetical protein ABT173_25640 [Streptomyces sp. NPDC001795]|uniref:hypothetical protein n=1 Tax=Streptomyces sp. NPDC001795 TaxID=3154525 RepID=UPI0033284F8E
MTTRVLDSGCLLLIWLPGVPSALASYAYERARYTLPATLFRADGNIAVPNPSAPAQREDGESRDAA